VTKIPILTHLGISYNKDCGAYIIYIKGEKMNFIKSLFGQKEKVQEFLATPSQIVDGFTPVEVYAIEKVFPAMQDQQEIYEHIRVLRGRTTCRTNDFLALVRYSDGNKEKLLTAPVGLYQFMVDELNQVFRNQEEINAWLESL
jgi:hypothetical protein